MKENIFYKLGKWWDKVQLKQKKFKKIPRDFWMDLNDSDFEKYVSSFPKSNGMSYTLLWISGVWKIAVSSFLLYVIADFMNYEVLLEVLRLFGSILLHGSSIITLSFVMFLFIDLINSHYLQEARKKHRLMFSTRVKKKK